MAGTGVAGFRGEWGRVAVVLSGAAAGATGAGVRCWTERAEDLSPHTGARQYVTPGVNHYFIEKNGGMKHSWYCGSEGNKSLKMNHTQTNCSIILELKFFRTFYFTKYLVLSP